MTASRRILTRMWMMTFGRFVFTLHIVHIFLMFYTGNKMTQTEFFLFFIFVQNFIENILQPHLPWVVVLLKSD